jgi:hypothetical protein
VASDDGINVVGDNDGSFMGERPVQGDFESLSNNYLYVNGGYTVIEATGDGLDINGSINMSGGIVIINGPTNDMNGAVDYYNIFSVSGGLLVAVGSSGMAQAPDTSSTQCSVLLAFDTSQPAGNMIHVETEDGKEILTFVPTKAYQSLLLCSAELEKGVSYNVYLGGSSTGTVTDGVCSGGTYSGGTLTASLTISSTVTSVGSAGGFNGGGGFPGGGGGMLPGGGRR